MNKLEKLNAQTEFSPMCDLAKKYGTDKYEHGYTKIYHSLMSRKKESKISILEMGIYNGRSIKMWEEFFQNGLICGVDNGRLLPNSNISSSNHINFNTQDDNNLLIEGGKLEKYDFSWLESERIKCAISDQRSKSHMEESFSYFGENMFDFIVDDGQHFQEHQLKSLGILFENVKSGGYYFIEDIVRIDGMIHSGDNWGQKSRSKNREDYKDCTEYVFENYINTGELKSEYLTDNQISYIKSNIEDIYLFNSDNFNLRTNSQLLVIKKK